MLLKYKNLTRWHKRLIILVADTTLLPLSLYLAFSLRFDTLAPMPFVSGSWVLFPLLSSLGCVLIYGLRLPHIKLATFENRAVLQIGLVAISLSTLDLSWPAICWAYLRRVLFRIDLWHTVLSVSRIDTCVLGLYLLNYLLKRGRRAGPARGYLRCRICGHSDGERLTASTRSTSGAFC